MKEIEEDTKKLGKTSYVHELEYLILLKCPHYQSDLQIQSSPYENINGSLCKTRKSTLKYIWKHKRPQITRTILRKKRAEPKVSYYLISTHTTKP
jgi:hypothetical protein